MYFYASILFKIFFKLLNLIYDMAIKPSCYYRGSMFYIRISKENIKIFFKTGSIFLPILYVLLNIVFHNVPNIGLFVFYIWIIIIILKHNIIICHHFDHVNAYCYDGYSAFHSPDESATTGCSFLTVIFCCWFPCFNTFVTSKHKPVPIKPITNTNQINQENDLKSTNTYSIWWIKL